ncbi:MAG: Gfo/Idh/MocA family protein [Thermoproteota archaeon]
MERFGTAVIGTGFWGTNHARVYQELEETELRAVCDIKRERARKVGRKFGATPYQDVEKMLEKEDIEGVSVCTWSTTLGEVSLKCLRAGKNVLVEKPMAKNSEQAEEMLETAEEKGLLLTVGFLMRFIPGIQHIKKQIEKKDIGNPVCITAKRVSQWPERIGDVGVVKDLAIHDIDITRYLFGEDPTAVYAKIGKMKHRKYEDYAQIMLTFEKSKNAFIEANWLTPYKTRRLIVTGSEAIMKLDYITQELTREDAEQTLKPRLPWQEPLKLELQRFANCILENEEPPIKGLDGFKALKVAEAALESSSIGEVIKLK